MANFKGNMLQLEGRIYCLSFSLWNRCTLLEPGPVSTSIGDNNVENTKGIDLKTADQKTQDLWVRMMERMGPAFEGKFLTPQAIAEVVQDIILSDKGQFRYLPNEGMFSEEITARFADATGFKSVNLVAKQFFDDK